jgi:hypothetical protein
MTALRNADSAGDQAAAARFAQMIQAQTTEDAQQPVETAAAQPVETQQEVGISDIFTGKSRMTPQMESMQEIGAAPELNKLSVPAFKASMGLLSTGDTKSLQGILTSQFGDDVSFEQDEAGNTIVNLPSGQYALNKPGMSGQDIVRGAFDMLAFTPAGRAASIPAAAAKSGLTELAIESTEQSLGGEDISAEEVGTSVLLGGFFRGAEDLIGAGYRALKGTSVDDLVSKATDAGIPMLTSDVKQPKTFAAKMLQQTGEKIPVAGTGGMRESQQLMRQQAVSDVAEKYGQFSYTAIIDSLKSQKNRIKSAAGSVLEGAGNKLDAVGQIPLDNTAKAIARAATELNKPGVIKSQAALDDLATLTQSIDEVPQTFTSLKENRTAFREIVKGADKAERSQLSSRAKSLLDNVERGMKADMTAHAKANLPPQEFSKWNKANAVYFDEAQKLTKTRLKNVLDKGDITPEAVETMLFSQKPSEVKALFNSLSHSGKQNARAAIISKAIASLNKRAAGLTPNSFASEMKKQGIQIDTFFKGEEKKQLTGLLDVLNATRRAQDAAVTTPTGQSLIGAGTGYAAFTDLTGTLATLGTLGGLARTYESAPVRNALLRLASVPKGSLRYEQALSEAAAALNAAGQTAKKESTDN